MVFYLIRVMTVIIIIIIIIIIIVFLVEAYYIGESLYRLSLRHFCVGLVLLYGTISVCRNLSTGESICFHQS